MSKDKRSKKKPPEKSGAKKELLAYKSEGENGPPATRQGPKYNHNSSTINKKAS